MAEIKWIKITTDIFDDEKMKIIDTLPDRDAIIVIWFKLLALTGKKNESGLLFLSSKMPYTDEMLATVFNRPLNTVRLALETFEAFDMIEIADNKVIAVVNWEKHQNIDGMEKIKEQNRLRQQKRRSKQKEEKLALEEPKVELIEDNVMSRDNHATDKIRLDKNRIEEIREDKTEDNQSIGQFLQHLLKHFKKAQLSTTMIDNVKRWCKDLELNPLEEIERSSYLKGNLDMKPTLTMFNKKNTYIKMKNGEYRNRDNDTKKNDGFVATVYTEEEEYSLDGLI